MTTAIHSLSNHGRLALFPRQLVILLFVLIAALSATRAAGDKVPLILYCSAYNPDFKTVSLKSGGDSFQDAELSTANVIEFPDAPVKDDNITGGG